MTTIEYGIAPLSQFVVNEREDSGHIRTMSVDGRIAAPSGRFWTSICSNFSSYGLSTKLFRLFSHREVFDRLTDVLSENGELQKTNLRYAIEKTDHGERLLAVTNPLKPLVHYEKAQAIMASYAGTSEYAGGIVRSTHTPKFMGSFKVGPDQFDHQYVMETPIDGFGEPLIYLSLLRLVCTNGAIGYARAFRSEIKLGKGDDDSTFIISKALDSFNNEEGYAALRARFEAAANSWASINECNRVYKLLVAQAQRGAFQDSEHKGMVDEFALRRKAVLNLDMTKESPVNTKIQRAFAALTGDLCEIYGLTQLDALSQKKMAKLPARCSMYDLLSFITEVATHYCTAERGRPLQAEVGSVISAEYDLEASKQDYPNFTDWFVT